METALAGGQLAFSYTLIYVSGIETDTVEVQSPAPPGQKGRDATGTSLSSPISLKQSTPPTKGFRGFSKKARQ